MTESLFDIQPVAPTIDPDLSADRKRTLRQRQTIDAGYHPLTKTLLHDQAGEGEPYTCGSCAFRELFKWHDRTYPKCTFGDGERVSHGAASDVRAWWPACRDWEPGDNAVSPRRSQIHPGGGEPMSDEDKCGFRSPNSDDGYCICIALRDHDGEHRCIHGTWR